MFWETVVVFGIALGASAGMLLMCFYRLVGSYLSNVTFYDERARERRTRRDTATKLSILYHPKGDVGVVREQIMCLSRLVYEKIGELYPFEIICLTPPELIHQFRSLRKENVEFVPCQWRGLKRLIIGLLASKGENVVVARYLPYLVEDIRAGLGHSYFVFAKPTQQALFEDRVWSITKPIAFSHVAGSRVFERTHSFLPLKGFYAEVVRICRARQVQIHVRRLECVKQEMLPHERWVARFSDWVIMKLFAANVWTFSV